MHGSDDVEAQRRGVKESFDNPSVRRTFIRKVFLIVTIQLKFSFAAVIITVSSEDVKSWVVDHSYMNLTVLLIIFVLLFQIWFYPDIARKAPWNFSILITFTCAITFFLCSLACYYSSEVLLMGLGTTAIITFVLILLAMQTTIDFTLTSGMTCVVITSLLLFTIAFICFRTKTLLFAISLLGVLLFSLFLIYDIQLTVNGENSFMVVRPEDYIIGSVQIYFDIILIFMLILRMFGLAD